MNNKNYKSLILIIFAMKRIKKISLDYILTYKLETNHKLKVMNK